MVLSPRQHGRPSSGGSDAASDSDGSKGNCSLSQVGKGYSGRGDCQDFHVLGTSVDQIPVLPSQKPALGSRWNEPFGRNFFKIIANVDSLSSLLSVRSRNLFKIIKIFKKV